MWGHGVYAIHESSQNFLLVEGPRGTVPVLGTPRTYDPGWISTSRHRRGTESKGWDFHTILMEEPSFLRLRSCTLYVSYHGPGGTSELRHRGDPTSGSYLQVGGWTRPEVPPGHTSATRGGGRNDGDQRLEVDTGLTDVPGGRTKETKTGRGSQMRWVAT